MPAQRRKVLVTGGSGYAGQFLLQSLAPDHEVHYTYHTRLLSSAPAGVTAHKVDLASGEGLQAAFDQTPYDVVVNCAAVAQPGACEAAPEHARAVNVPTHLVDCLLRQERQRGVAALLIHFSTDQVYDGSRSSWKEDLRCEPINVYGRTKLEAEQLILSRLPEPSFQVAILRCSIIYGPPPPDPTPATPFLQFVAAALRGQQPTVFFHDEWRNPVYVRDLQRLVGRLVAGSSAGATATNTAATAAAGKEQDQQQQQHQDTAGMAGSAAAEAAEGAVTAAAGKDEAMAEMAAVTVKEAAGSGSGSSSSSSSGGRSRRYRVYNSGGPERLSRVEMATQVADCLGCGHHLIRAASNSTAPKTVPRPQDISMDVSRLAEDLGFRPTPFRAALKEIFGGSC